MAPTENSQPIKVAAYARVSTGDQHLENQLNEIEAVIANRGWELDETFTDVMSGAKDARPGLAELLHHVEAGGRAATTVGPQRRWPGLPGWTGQRPGLECDFVLADDAPAIGISH